MKLRLAVLGLAFSLPLFSHAECISLDVAKKIASLYLKAYGEESFPEAYFKLSVTDKAALSAEVIKNLTDYAYDDRGPIAGYSSLVYETRGEDMYEAYLRISCEGDAKPWTQSRQD